MFDNPLVMQRADPHVTLQADGYYYLTATAPEYDRIEVRRAGYKPITFDVRVAEGSVTTFRGTLEPIARALGSALGVRHVCATLCDERQGRYTSAAPHRHP